MAIFAGLAGLGILTFGVSYLLMLERLQKQLDEQHELSLQSWTDTPVPAA
jgi:hypothetical protein